MPTITVTSYFGQLLLTIQELIKVEVPEIKWVDQDFGQLEEYETRPPVQWPCLLVDFGSTNYDMQGNQVQWANSTIQFRLGFDTYSSANSAVPLNHRQTALEYYELEQTLYKKLQAWDGGGLCQPMTRISSITEQREDKYRVRVMLFTTVFDDDSASPDYERVKPDLTVEFD